MTTVSVPDQAVAPDERVLRAVVVGFYRVCVIDQILAYPPADYVGQLGITRASE
jgi:hypothetical protein